RGQVLAAGGLVLGHRVAALLDHLVQHADHRGIVQLDALVDFLLLDRGVDQPDHGQGFLVAALHGGLHVVGQTLLEAHRTPSKVAKSKPDGRPGRCRGEHKKPATRRRAGFGALYTMRPRTGGMASAAQAQYRRWRLVTSRDMRRSWRFTAAAALRLRSWVGFS